jgi:hypothetical protein
MLCDRPKIEETWRHCSAGVSLVMRRTLVWTRSLWKAEPEQGPADMSNLNNSMELREKRKKYEDTNRLNRCLPGRQMLVVSAYPAPLNRGL